MTCNSVPDMGLKRIVDLCLDSFLMPQAGYLLDLYQVSSNKNISFIFHVLSFFLHVFLAPGHILIVSDQI